MQKKDILSALPDIPEAVGVAIEGAYELGTEASDVLDEAGYGVSIFLTITPRGAGGRMGDNTLRITLRLDPTEVGGFTLEHELTGSVDLAAKKKLHSE